jgi:predicted DsbA family dithiol-disulfide isomerase
MKRKKIPEAPSRHRRPTITYLIAESIRKRVADGAVQADLAEEFGVHASEICQIISRKRFREDYEWQSVWRQMSNAENIYEAAQKRWSEFTEKRKREQEKIDRRASLLHKAGVKNNTEDALFTTPQTSSEVPNVHFSSVEK